MCFCQPLDLPHKSIILNKHIRAQTAKFLAFSGMVLHLLAISVGECFLFYLDSVNFVIKDFFSVGLD